MGLWFNLPQTWINTTGLNIEYINYNGPYYSYDNNILFSSAGSTSEAESWFSSMEITTPIKRRGAKMG